MVSSIECDVCHKIYNDLERKPKFLKCFHTFCLSCLEDLMNNQATNEKTISCPTCSEETIVKDDETLDSVLQTNFYISRPTQATTEKSDPSLLEATKEIRYYWCSNCKSVVDGESTCFKNQHDTCDIETDEDIREMAEMSLKMVFVTCKSQLNGALGKYRTVESDLKASQIALQAMEQQANSLRKENDRQMKKLQKHLSEVANQLSKASNHKFTTEEMYKLFETYKKIMSDSEDKSKYIGDQLVDFESIRNAVVSTKIKTSTGEELSAPLLNSAVLNFPSAGGANELEKNMLTSLSFFVVSCIQNGQWTKPAPHSKPQEESKKKSKGVTESGIVAKGESNDKKENKVKKNKAEAVEKESKTESGSNRKENKLSKGNEQSKTGAGEKTYPKQQHGSSTSKTPHPTKFDNKFKDQHRNEPRKSHTSNAQPPVAVRGKFATGNTSFQNVHPVQPFNIPPPPQTRNVQPFAPGMPPPPQNRNIQPFPPSIPPSMQSHNIQSSPLSIPPPMQTRNKKAFFVLAVNGKNYGTVVFDLRPDLAPVMCQRFFQNCQGQEGSYQGTVIYQSKPKICIMGGRLPGPESLYMADTSPLKKTRGSIFLRLKRDYAKTQCSIVSSEFGIHLGDPEEYKTTTVFGTVRDGLAVCDAISHMNCSKDHIAIASAGIVG